MVSFRRLAYGKPQPIKGHGKTWNRLADVGVKIRQVLIFRPAYVGYRYSGKKK